MKKIPLVTIPLIALGLIVAQQQFEIGKLNLRLDYRPPLEPVGSMTVTINPGISKDHLNWLVRYLDRMNDCFTGEEAKLKISDSVSVSNINLKGGIFNMSKKDTNLIVTRIVAETNSTASSFFVWNSRKRTYEQTGWGSDSPVVFTNVFYGIRVDSRAAISEGGDTITELGKFQIQ